MEFTIQASNGVTLIPYSSHAMNRTISFKYHKPITGGTIEVKARPFGRSEFLSIDGAPAFPASSENTITISYPVAELQVAQADITGGSIIFLTVAEGA